MGSIHNSILPIKKTNKRLDFITKYKSGIILNVDETTAEYINSGHHILRAIDAHEKAQGMYYLKGSLGDGDMQ